MIRLRWHSNIISLYLDDMPVSPQIIFVVGFARSGTTLLATLLDRHSQMAATPETHFFSQVLPQGAAPDAQYDAEAIISRFLASERVQDLELSTDDFRELLHEGTCSWRDVLSCAIAAYATRHGVSIVVEKTPAHLTKTSQILEWYPDAKVVHVIRDGRDAVLSLLRAPWTHCNLRRHARAWRWCIKRMQRFREKYPSNILEVRYEALLGDPENTLRNVCNYIGVAFEPTQLHPGDDKRTIPAWESEWKAKASETLDTSRIQAWKRTATRQQRWLMNSMMGGTLRKNGYDDTTLSDCPHSTRLGNVVANFVFLVLYHPRLKPTFVAIKRGLRILGIPTDRIDRPGPATE